MQQKINKAVRVQASIRLTDDSILNGTVNCGITGRIESVLNTPDSFIEFTSRDGQQRFISRHQIASVEPLETVREPALPEINENEQPYRVLGLRHGSGPDAVRVAYERLSKAYGVEKWAGVDVPPEIAKYASDKLRQINAAYTILKGETEKPAAAGQPPASPAAERPHRPAFGQTAGAERSVPAAPPALASQNRSAAPSPRPHMTPPASTQPMPTPAPRFGSAAGSSERPASPPADKPLTDRFQRR